MSLPTAYLLLPVRRAAEFTVVLLLAGMGVLSAGAGERRYLAADTVVERLAFEVLPDARALAVEARVAFDFRRGQSASWAFEWTDSAGSDWKCRVSQCDPFMVSSFDLPTALIEIVDPDGSVVASGTLSEGIDANGGYNTLAMEWSGRRLQLLYGARRLVSVADDVVLPPPAQPEMRITASGSMKLGSLIVEETPDPSLPLEGGISVEEADARIKASADPMEGMWVYLDRQNDPAYARPGGIYSLCVLREDDGSYTLYYRSGAQVNAEAWRPMLVKAVLTPTPFEAHYDLRWFDSMMEPVADEAHATYDPSRGILTLVFPLHHTTLRFYRQ